jgi:hypothetical protein
LGEHGREGTFPRRLLSSENIKLDATVLQAGNTAAARAVPPQERLAPTLFHEEWWLDVATAGRHGVAEVYDNEILVGRMPYYRFRRHGLMLTRMPPMTHFIGPAVDEGVGSPISRFRRRLAITRELIAQLPSASSHYIKCHRGVSDVLAFQMERFTAGVQFTYEFEGRSVDEFRQGIFGKTRNDIRRGEKSLRIATMTDPAEFVRFYRENLDKRGLRSMIDFAASERLVAACLERKRGRIDAVYSAAGVLEAAAFSAWDRNVAYGLMSTRRPDSGNLAGCLLVWEAIRSAIGDGLIFDMAGIGSDGSVKFLSGFGGVIRPRYIVRRDTLVGELACQLAGRIAKRPTYY